MAIKKASGQIPKLSARHERFIQEYLRTENATYAYISAGYSSVGANGNASRLIATDTIQEALVSAREAYQHRAHVTREDILGVFIRTAFGDKKVKHYDRNKAANDLWDKLGFDKVTTRANESTLANGVFSALERIRKRESK